MRGVFEPPEHYAICSLTSDGCSSGHPRDDLLDLGLVDVLVIFKPFQALNVLMSHIVNLPNTTSETFSQSLLSNNQVVVSATVGD